MSIIYYDIVKRGEYRLFNWEIRKCYQHKKILGFCRKINVCYILYVTPITIQYNYEFCIECVWKLHLICDKSTGSFRSHCMKNSQECEMYIKDMIDGILQLAFERRKSKKSSTIDNRNMTIMCIF